MLEVLVGVELVIHAVAGVQGAVLVGVGVVSAPIAWKERSAIAVIMELVFMGLSMPLLEVFSNLTLYYIVIFNY